MTRYENKEYNRLKRCFERWVIPELRKKETSYDIRRFCLEVMDLLDEYHIKDIQYRERIKTLKEVIKNDRCRTN